MSKKLLFPISIAMTFYNHTFIVHYPAYSCTSYTAFTPIIPSFSDYFISLYSAAPNPLCMDKK